MVSFCNFATAQVSPPIVCSTSAEPQVVAAGQAERSADLIITCTGGRSPAPGAALPQMNITVTLSAAVANHEVMLTIDNPEPNNQSVCATSCSPLFAGAMAGTATESNATGTVRNVFRGTRQNDTTIVWLQVPMSAPGTQGARVFRTKNLKVAGNAPAGQVFAFVSIQNPPTNLELTTSTVNVAEVRTGVLQAALRR